VNTADTRFLAGFVIFVLLSALAVTSPYVVHALADNCKWRLNGNVSCGVTRTSPGNNSGSNNSKSDSRKRSGKGKNGSSGNAPEDYCPNSIPTAVCATLDLPDTSGPAELPPPPPSPTFMESEFKKYSIPPSVINSLPGDSWGIAHRKTAFWADSSIQYINDTILGYPITVKAIPRKYHWDFGDGNTLHTSHPGNKPSDINKARIYNVYQAPGNVAVKLATTYTGMYKIGNSAWMTIPGSTDIPSQDADLRIYRFHKYLVNKSCKEDPTGPDCTQ
ncbi:hypothetical protein, partial [Brevibacterium paucivorans]